MISLARRRSGGCCSNVLIPSSLSSTARALVSHSWAPSNGGGSSAGGLTQEHEQAATAAATAARRPVAADCRHGSTGSGSNRRGRRGTAVKNPGRSSPPWPRLPPTKRGSWAATTTTSTARGRYGVMFVRHRVDHIVGCCSTVEQAGRASLPAFTSRVTWLVQP